MSAAGSNADDEFRFLAADARRVGLSGVAPRVERVQIHAPDHRAVSGLAFASERAPEIVALHGAGLNAHSFDPMLLALGRPALAVDLPGHGRSDWRDDADYRPAGLARDLAHALDPVVPGPVTLLGHSLGGLTAALLAAERPDIARRLILVDITPGVSPARDAGTVREFIQGQRDFADIPEIVARAQRFGIGGDAEALTRGIALNTRRRPDGRLEWTHHLAHLDGLPTSEAPGDSHPRSRIWDALASLAARGVPIALIAAEQGMVSTELLADWRSRLPQSTVHRIAGPHNLHESAPLELAQLVSRLMTE